MNNNIVALPIILIIIYICTCQQAAEGRPFTNDIDSIAQLTQFRVATTTRFQFQYLHNQSDLYFGIREIIVQSGNNYNPFFINRTLYYEIEENIANNTIIGQVMANDPDHGKVYFTFSQMNQGQQDYFNIDRNHGQLTSINNIDYETVPANPYILNVTAHDYGIDPSRHDTRQLTITIIDVPETPQFVDGNGDPIQAYSFEVNKKALQGSVVGTVYAVDPDGPGAGNFSTA